MEARVKPTSWNGTDRFAGLAARLQDRYNGYVLALRSSGRVELLRIASGSTTALATRTFPVTLGTWYTLRIDAVGTTLRGYVNGALQFTATDGTFTAGLVGGATDYATASFDDFRVTQGGIPPGNQAPQVQAGGDQVIVLSAAASLFGSVTDDGLPTPPGAVTCTWSQTSGPGTVTFAPNANTLQASARFSAVGVYVLTLTCSDSLLSASDSLTVDVRDDGESAAVHPRPGRLRLGERAGSERHHGRPGRTDGDRLDRGRVPGLHLAAGSLRHPCQRPDRAARGHAQRDLAQEHHRRGSRTRASPAPASTSATRSATPPHRRPAAACAT